MKCAYIGKYKERLQGYVDHMVKDHNKPGSVPPVASVHPMAQPDASQPATSKPLKRKPDAIAATPPVAKNPPPATTTEEPIDAAPISSAPPASRNLEASAAHAAETSP